MGKKNNEEYTNDRTLSDILGIQNDENNDEVTKLANTKLKIDDLNYIKQTVKHDEDIINIPKETKNYKLLKFIALFILIVMIVVILYCIIY